MLKPLVAALTQAEDVESEETVALASVFVGLLSFHLLIPASPLDPGMKPAAKVLEWTSHIQRLSSRLVSIRMEAGLSTGDFYPTSPVVSSLTEELSYATQKMKNQDKKIVNRPSGVPGFNQLFREILHFSKTIANVKTIVGLVSSLNNDSANSKHFSSEKNWQCSASAFFNKVTTKYGCYEDVTSPFLAALGIIQNGLRVYSSYQLQSNELYHSQISSIQDSLLQYPNVSHHNNVDLNCIGSIAEAFESQYSTLSGEKFMSKLAKKSKFSFLMATLSHLELMKSVGIPKNSDLVKVSSGLFASIARAWDLATDLSVSKNTDKSVLDENEEERNQREFREHFPDHGKDFTKIIETVEAEAAGEDIDQNDDQNDNAVFVENITISDHESTLLAEMHYSLYSKRKVVPTDLNRTQTFSLMYTAASLLNNLTSRSNTIKSENIRLNGHCFALGLGCSNQHISMLSSSATTCNNNSSPDFHKDANPIEAQKAYRPLKELLHWITQLLRAFPGNAILVAVGQLVETMLQLDINKVPLGKMLTGLEMILRKAQDWEQHASHRVALGEKITQVSRLVAAWRKLELQSWSNLLNFRDKHYLIQTRKHWMRLHLLLISDNLGDLKNEHGLFEDPALPIWLWKGVTNHVSHLSKRVSPKVDEMMIEIVKALDTFILTAGVGEFHERLRLIESFAAQIREESLYSVNSSKKVKATVLTSLFEHYSKFIPVVEFEKMKLRGPIETKLKNEVKLAKWDEQSYYALAESAEKSHMKLMRIVREYDEVLQINVAKILEENFLNGVRNSSEVSNGSNSVQPITEIPSNMSMFPQIIDSKDGEESTPMCSIFSKKAAQLGNPKRLWVTEDKSNGFKYLTELKKYSNRMSQIFLSRMEAEIETHASKGAQVASLLSTSIFERIQSLRSKGTKPMKQRALLDLFKSLKNQGYSWMKWSVPNEIRDMNFLLQLPTPSLESLESLGGTCRQLLQESDDYFRRCTVELSRLRSEVALVGSNYMSKREMDLMTGYGDHGLLLLCQQRSVLMKITTNFKFLSNYINAFDQIATSLPRGQQYLLEAIQQFNQLYITLIELIQQLMLAIKTNAAINKEQGECYRDLIGKLEGSFSTLRQLYQPNSNDLFITTKHLEQIVNVKENLEKIKKDILSYQSYSRQSCCLPTTFFEACLDHIEKTMSCAQSFDCASCRDHDLDEDKDWIGSVTSLLSKIVESSLLAAQTLHKGSFEKRVENENNDDEVQSEDDTTIWTAHVHVLNEWNSIHLDNFNQLLFDLRTKLVTKPSLASMNKLDQLSADVCCLVLKVLDKCAVRLGDHISFFRSVAKFEYIKLRLFRVLISKGFCADDVQEGGDGEGDAGNMTFEDDVEGTGMGEGEGKNDVTDEIDNEEQLLGLKGEQEKDDKQQNKELGEEEADTGMEMENDFDGELFDVPDKKETEDGKDEKGEEELDREMGDDYDPNEQVVDEKMWDEDEDEGEEKGNEEEKFEKDSKVSGEALQDEMRTKEEDEEGGDSKQENNDDKPEMSGEQKHDDDAGKDDADDQKGKEEDMVNNDFEDDYEDQHTGIDVRNEEDGDMENEPENDEDEGMDIDDNLSLDSGEGGDENAMAEDSSNVEKPEDQEEEVNDEGEDMMDEVDKDGAEDNPDDEQEDMDTDIAQNAHQNSGQDDQLNANEEMEDSNEEKEEDDLDNKMDANNHNENNSEAQGIAAKSGADKIQTADDNGEDEDNDEGMGDENDEQEQGTGEADMENNSPRSGEQTNERSGEFQNGQEESPESRTKDTAMDAPNPFRDPGDAEKFWHRKLDMVDNENNEDEQTNDYKPQQSEDRVDNEKESNGLFEFTSENQDSKSQVLAEVTEEESPQLDQNKEHDENVDNNDVKMDDESKDLSPKEQQASNQEKKKERDQRTKNKEAPSSSKLEKNPENKQEGESSDKDDTEMEVEESKSAAHQQESDNDDDQDNKVVTDLAQLQVKDEVEQNKSTTNTMIEYESQGFTSQRDAEEARQMWSQLSAETNSLSRRLCEKLRLVMEPLVASKLRGDYRTGKRINMKRVIGYIASGYRKDKIWLRRTKPGKRDYRVLLAVDNSESMKSGAGDVALMALATLATGMSQLEIGQLGVASFGEEMKLIHPFHAPFTATSGADLVSNFTFEDKRTRTALCVESAMAALESQVDSSCSMQLVFMISDGRIERDSRDELRRLVREMTERSILLVMIIVEGDRSGNTKMKDSIVNMKEVSFHNGKPKVKHFIDDYPFPYYMILQDMNTLPEVLGDALKQWFEMMAQNKS